jgi:hypothetical protein
MSNLFVQKISKSSFKKTPYKVYYIVESLEEYDPTPLNKLKELLEGQDIVIQVREFNSVRYADDRDIIEYLPAFHLYINKECMKTFYTDSNFIEEIQDGIDEYNSTAEHKWSIVKWLTKRTPTPFKIKTI